MCDINMLGFEGVSMSVKRIHHINFIVKDLDEGIKYYERILGDGVFVKDDLTKRGVATARTNIDGQWFVLVQPTDLESVPGRHFKEHGEGFFLISFEVESMEKSVSEFESKGLAFTDASDRKGLLNWWIRDLKKNNSTSPQIQLCEERD